jgi:hypothetical protein
MSGASIWAASAQVSLHFDRLKTRAELSADQWTNRFLMPISLNNYSGEGSDQDRLPYHLAGRAGEAGQGPIRGDDSGCLAERQVDSHREAVSSPICG